MHFYATDRDEPRHVHVARSGSDAKFWLDPEVRLARNHGLPEPELRRVMRIIETNARALRDAWDAFFNR
jgi:hypothetical protein